MCKSNKKPLVTVALAVYNNAEYLEECLNCAENQTYENIEILCVDDCSTDSSAIILQNHAKSDPRFRVIVKDKNVGLSDTRNISLAEAKGEYIFFCDADDVFNNDLIEKAITKAESEKADMVIWDFYEFGDPIYKLMKREDPSRLSGAMTRKELARSGSFMWTHLFRTSSLRALNLPFPLGRTKQDLPIHWAACICLDKISIIPERLYGYRIGQSQTSRKKGEVLFDFIHVHDYLREYLEKNGKFMEYSSDYYQSLAITIYTVCSNIKLEYKDKAIVLSKERVCPQMVEVSKRISPSVRLFISSLNGNSFAGALLSLSQFYRRIIHK